MEQSRNGKETYHKQGKLKRDDMTSIGERFIDREVHYLPLQLSTTLPCVGEIENNEWTRFVPNC